MFALITVPFLGAQLYGWANSAAALAIDLSPFHVRIVEDGPSRTLQEEAENLIARIEDAYPPNAAGVARILPWNWSVEPVIPEEAMAAFERIKEYRGLEFDVPITPITAAKDLANIGPLAEFVPERRGYDRQCVAISRVFPVLLIPSSLCLCVYISSVFLLLFFMMEQMRRMEMVMVMAMGMGMGMGMGKEMSLLTGMACALPILTGHFLSRTSFPRNPLLPALNDLPGNEVYR
uniref:Uncharacterized protein n=1 Tax=Candidatus Kentrum eta TaxID=2126337 RepID=A0A450V2E4_9GAMM|nr:MAG: hypothetical protein BECKH772B_GA0070898_101473 [Candidatus Kentron sp. H]